MPLCAPLGLRLRVLLPVTQVFTHAARLPPINATQTCIQVVLAAAINAGIDSSMFSCAVFVCHNKLEKRSSRVLRLHTQTPCDSTLQLPTNTRLEPAQ